MKPFLFTFVLILLSLLAFGQTQYGIDQQAGKAYQQANKTLDSVYHQIVKEYKADTAFLRNLRVAQRAWIAFRDAQFKMKYPDRPRGYYGSILPMCESYYREELTNQRIKTLREWLNGADQGDACCGSIRMNR